VLARQIVHRALLFFSSLIAVSLIAELGLRLALAPQLAVRRFDPEPHVFALPDSELGWDNPRSLEISYSDGFFHGEIHFDEDALRLNSGVTTFRDGWVNLLFIGDSTTASLEVNDAETIPALVERALRKRGEEVNVLNLGVRGYGTGQTVDKAIRIAELRGAREAIYLFVPNDVYETNVAKTWGFPHSKPLYLWDSILEKFIRRPVEPLSIHEGRIVILDDACRPYLHEGATASMPRREGDSPLADSYLYRAYYRFVEIERIHASAVRVEPDDRIRNGESWSHGFIAAYLDDGTTRNRCPEYFTRQMRFHLERLREDAALEKIYVVHFPNDRVRRMQREGGSPNVQMFKNLLELGVVDNYLDLNEEATSRGDSLYRLRCPSDPHFCRAGNEWIASRFLEHFESELDRTAP